MRYFPSRLFAALVRPACRAALRVVITGLIFTVCLKAVSAYMGVPLPDLRELLDRFESVTQLSKFLS